MKWIHKHNFWRTMTTTAWKCPYSEFFGSVFSPNAKKYGPEKPRIRALSHTVMIPVTLIFSSILVTVMIFMLKCGRLGFMLVGLPFLTL